MDKKKRKESLLWNESSLEKQLKKIHGSPSDDVPTQQPITYHDVITSLPQKNIKVTSSGSSKVPEENTSPVKKSGTGGTKRQPNRNTIKNGTRVNKKQKLNKTKNGTRKITKQRQVRLDKTKIDAAVMKLFVWDFQPFTIVEDKGFKNLMNTCTPTYKIPSREYFSDILLPARFKETCGEVKTILKKEALSTCITIDTWASSTNDNYCAITAHYIHEDFKLKTVLLDCSVVKDFYTPENLAEYIRKVVDDFSINDKITVAISDNSSNIADALSSILKWQHFGCYGHKLNMIVAMLPVEEIIKKVKATVTYFNKSNEATQKLLSYQTETGIKEPKRLLRAAATRWISTYSMLNRFILLEDAIKHNLLLSDLASLTSTEWETCKELCKALEPCAEVTKELISESYMTASNIIPITRGLKSSLKKLLSNVKTDPVKQIIKTILSGIETKYNNLEKNKTLTLCTFLDPRYKHHLFEEKGTADWIKTITVQMVEELLSQKGEPKVMDDQKDVSSTSKEIEKKTVSIWEDYDTTISTVKSKETIASQEVQRYMDEEPITRIGNPVDWWNNHKHFYPNLAYLVRTKCNMVATSVPGERIFSDTGNIILERRARLSATNIKELVFLNMNMK